MWNVCEMTWVYDDTDTHCQFYCADNSNHINETEEKEWKKNGDRCSNRISIMLIIRSLLFYTACMEHMEHYYSTLFSAQYNQSKMLPNSQTRRIFCLEYEYGCARFVLALISIAKEINVQIHFNCWCLFNDQRLLLFRLLTHNIVLSLNSRFAVTRRTKCTLKNIQLNSTQFIHKI